MTGRFGRPCEAHGSSLADLSLNKKQILWENFVQSLEGGHLYVKASVYTRWLMSAQQQMDTVSLVRFTLKSVPSVRDSRTNSLAMGIMETVSLDQEEILLNKRLMDFIVHQKPSTINTCQKGWCRSGSSSPLDITTPIHTLYGRFYGSFDGGKRKGFLTPAACLDEVVENYVFVIYPELQMVHDVIVRNAA